VIGLGLSSGSGEPPDSTSHAGVATVAVGSVIAWVGFAVLLVGLIAVGVYLGTRHLYGGLPATEGAAVGPAAPPQAGWSQAGGGDGTMFEAQGTDSPVVAQVRAMYLNGAPFALKATTASVRRIMNRAERRRQLSEADREQIESMIADAHRRKE
jgi:hypothetical protein